MKKIILYTLIFLSPIIQAKSKLNEKGIFIKEKYMTETILNKNVFDIPEDDLLVQDVPFGLVVVSHKISREKLPIRFLYREQPSQEYPDSGWRFFSGYEDNEYTNNSNNFSIYSLTRLANYQPEISGDMLYSPIGSVFEKRPESDQFEKVSDWSIPKE
ncbi:DUF2185 domain-containing protein [Pasteurella sp. PK-2025]|uniref:DUF2185 domain-containing protein n=1 Tax=unclassified Pasteurella TaxID=2621516 RepID=UPI003C7166FD